MVLENSMMKSFSAKATRPFILQIIGHPECRVEAGDTITLFEDGIFQIEKQPIKEQPPKEERKCVTCNSPNVNLLEGEYIELVTVKEGSDPNSIHPSEIIHSGNFTWIYRCQDHPNTSEK